MSKGQWTVSIIRQDCCSDMVVQVRKETNVISHIHGLFLFLLQIFISKCTNVTQLLPQKIVPRQLRCNDRHLLQVPLTSIKYTGDRSFQKASPMLYNVLPGTI